MSPPRALRAFSRICCARMSPWDKGTFGRLTTEARRSRTGVEH
jgi:hypothetical protein